MPSSRLLCLSSRLLCVLIVSSSRLCPSWLPVLTVCRPHLPPVCVSLICLLSTVSSCTLYLYILRYTIHILTYQISIYCTYRYTYTYTYTVHRDTLYIYLIHTHLIYTVHIYLIQIYLIHIIRQYIIYTLYTLYIYRYYIHIHHIIINII